MGKHKAKVPWREQRCAQAQGRAALLAGADDHHLGVGKIGLDRLEEFVRRRVLPDEQRGLEGVRAGVQLAHDTLKLALVDRFHAGGGDHDIGAVVACRRPAGMRGVEGRVYTLAQVLAGILDLLPPRLKIEDRRPAPL